MSRVPSLAVSTTARRVLTGLGTGLGIGLLLVLLRGTQAVEQVELALVDVRTRRCVGCQRKPDPRILIAEVREQDNRTMLQRAGEPWPWTENILHLIPRCLKAAGAAGLVVDVMYYDRGHDPLELPLEVRKQRAMTEGAEPHPDSQIYAEQGAIALYVDALRQLDRVALGMHLVRSPRWETEGRAALARRLATVAVEGAPPPNFLGSRGADLSVRALLASERALGFVNAAEDVDGIVRHGVPVARWKDQPVPSLSLAGARLLEPDVVAGRDFVRVGDKTQRLGTDGRFLANFLAGEGEAYTYISPFQLADWGALLEGDDPEPLPDHAVELLRDKIVIFGANVLGHEDVVGSPIADRLHGPELQAVLLDNLLHGDGRVRVSRIWNALLLVAACALLGVLGAALKRRLLPVLVSVLVAVALWWVGERLFENGWSIDLFTPWLGIGLTSLATTGIRLFTEGRRNKWLQGTFSRYLAPDVIKALQADPTRLALGGRRRELTILFSDVAGFTKISEQLDAENVVRLLNRYLTGQSSELMEQGGVIDKFEGDAIMAFFGDPLDMSDHAIRACRAAVHCIRELPNLEPVWRKLGLESFRVRIGVNTGEALVGNMGSDRRFDYTCMGDSVNLASRLEGANKHFGSVIMIGETTYRQAQPHILAKPLADLVVVGKTEPVGVYELVSLSEDASASERGHVEAFAAAHAALRADDLEAAREALAQARALAPDDGPCAWLGGLIVGLSEGSVQRPWDGRVVLSSK